MASRVPFWLWEAKGPRRVKGGIRAGSGRSAFGERWWAKRWIAVVESFSIGGRLQRARSYARKGQVLSIDVRKGVIRANVQGSRKDPYRVEITLPIASRASWKKVSTVLRRESRFAAALMAGEMPEDLEPLFRKAGVPLFPRRGNDLRTSCSCPDWSNPCKHVAAVYYLLALEFDRDPFILLTLRGITRQELSVLLRPARLGKRAGRHAESGQTTVDVEPLPTDATAFWRGHPLPEGFIGDIRTPYTAAGLLRAVGRFPFWRATEELLESLEALYRDASERAIEALED